METTDREDLGTDLNAPERTEKGREYWSYSFVREVREGDVVLHYRAPPIGACSRARGGRQDRGRDAALASQARPCR
jgi:hypothetical protein